MKRLFLLLSTLLILQLSSAQEAKRYVLIEHFTNTRCSICSSSNPAFFSAIEPHEQDVHHIAYHPSFPYSSCVFYQHNTTENQNRAILYSVPGTPSTYLWGSKLSAGSNLLPGNSLPEALNQTSPLQILVDEELSGSGRAVTIRIKSVGTPPSGGDYRLFAAVVEKTINYAAPNGEDEHHNVFRKMLPSSDGESFVPSAQGGEVSFTFNYDFHPEWSLTQIYVVAFVQDMNTKEIFNSGSTLDVQPATAIDPELNARVSVFPNPVSSFLQIDWQGAHGNQAQASLFSLTGQQIKTQKSSSPGQRMAMDLSDIPGGLYYLQFELDGKKAVRKVNVGSRN